MTKPTEKTKEENSHQLIVQELENLKEVLSRLLVMQKVLGTTLECVVDILLIKGLISQEEYLEMNKDVSEALTQG